LGDIEPHDICVQLYADPSPVRSVPFCEVMQRGERITGAAQGFTYHIRVAKQGVAREFTPRVIPRHDFARVPAELELIVWGEPVR
jgi:starch phosphorylase